MGLYEELLKNDAKLIAGGAAQNTARGAQVLACSNSDNQVAKMLCS
jgi:adenosine kinase